LKNKAPKDREKRKVRHQAQEAMTELNRLETREEAGEKQPRGSREVVLGRLEDFPEDFPLETF